jgi:hypothetical protein
VAANEMVYSPGASAVIPVMTWLEPSGEVTMTVAPSGRPSASASLPAFTGTTVSVSTGDHVTDPADSSWTEPRYVSYPAAVNSSV